MKFKGQYSWRLRIDLLISNIINAKPRIKEVTTKEQYFSKPRKLDPTKLLNKSPVIG